MNDEPDIAPPNYPEPDVTDVPPDYSAGTLYTIGRHKFHTPLVQVSHLKAHLCLLRAIHDLKQTVTAGEDSRIPPQVSALEPWKRWTWFVSLAVERFERWLTTMQPSPLSQWIQEELPPVDVLMVWQAYMLNPIWYAEDCDRIPMLRKLRTLGRRLLTALMEVGDINEHNPSSARRDRWVDRTHTTFDPLDAAMLLKMHSVECPQCSTRIDCPFIDPLGTGYSQLNFTAQCTSCSLVLTRESLAVVKFTHDFALNPQSPEDLDAYGDGVCMAGTLRSVQKGITRAQAMDVKAFILGCYPLSRPTSTTSKWEWQQAIYKTTGFSMTPILAAILSPMTAKSFNVQRVLSAYSDDRPFSVDLVGSVVRLSTFVDELYNAHWLEPGHFGEDAEDDLVLSQAISRYHAFLDLIATSTGPKILFVPTLDIDLVWHTHQMMGDVYHAKCAKYLQRFLDHYDRVEENMLAYCFDATSRAWKDRFGLQYSYCGCALPGDKIGDRLSRLKSRLRNSLNTTGDLVPLQREDAVLATHASVHNAFPFPGKGPIREKRLEKIRKRTHRDRKKEQPNVPHEPAFLHFLPIYKEPKGQSVVPNDVVLSYSWVLGGGIGNDGYTIPSGGANDSGVLSMYMGPSTNVLNI
ncbi:hypothetical protein NM688_g1483 [Phlebia brevispora]|uniref:Uncharacterized protein n=1 Tax=Phlebia brevispora TaxID=194682 RepID=A0ACC1TBJ8_9APHY|nr:hypothetical protein NM688_g1483 [Phlebia brevispora]